MVSKTAMLALVKAFKWKEIDQGMAESSGLIAYRDQRGRNWLHLCCGVNPRRANSSAANSVKSAEVLLKRGIDINQEAFVEGTWKATALWYAIARGENLLLAEYLLNHGSSSNYCLWAAAFNEDLDAIRLLLRHGANVNDVTEDETPFLHAVKWSHFRAAEELLKHGANVNYQDSSGMTALHYMLKKGSDKQRFSTFIANGARGDIPDKHGRTAIEIMRRRRDPDFKRMAERLQEEIPA